MQKYNKSEGKIQVLTGRQANVLHSHFQRTGKTDIGNFTDEEKENFYSELEQARKEDEEEQRDLERASSEGMPESDKNSK